MQDIIFSTELVTFLLCVVVYSFVIYNKPKRTALCTVNLLGIFSVACEMLLEIFMDSYIQLSAAPKHYIISGIIVLHLITHIVTYVCLVGYINLLSLYRRMANKKYYIAYIIIFSFYILLCAILCAYGKMYTLENHSLNLTHYIWYFSILSCTTSIVFYIHLFFHKQDLPKNLSRIMLLFMPIMVIVQLIQAIHSEVVFHGIIYILPLMVFYFFYHNNPYDQLTGYQDSASCDSMIQYCTRHHKRFHMIYVELPMLKNSDYYQRIAQSPILVQAHAEVCRAIEYVHKNIYIYRVSISSYVVIYLPKKSDKENFVISKIKTILMKASQDAGPYFYFYGIHTICDDTTKIFDNGYGILTYRLSQMSQQTVDTWIEVEPEDYEKYMQQYEIIQNLREIQSTRDLNDERVICYAQPIYDVSSGEFRTAEALMRMKINGKVVFPDQFIPLAEQNECIHTLTCIMLNKVCQQIKILQKDYRFEAITVNLSSIELSATDLFEELTKIIEQNGIDPSYLRIELTESAMFDDFEIVKQNIKNLRDYGIKFYLDDFGTGYSNFERIISCPFDLIKFDKSLLYKAVSSESIDDIISNMISIFKHNGFKVLVEGVEDEQQMNFSIEKGFEFLQGYHFAKPVPFNNLTQYFTKKNGGLS